MFDPSAGGRMIEKFMKAAALTLAIAVPAAVAGSYYHGKSVGHDEAQTACAAKDTQKPSSGTNHP